MLVALSTAVAGDAGDTVLAGTLSCGLVARLARRSHRVAVTGWGGVMVGRRIGVNSDATKRRQNID